MPVEGGSRGNSDCCTQGNTDTQVQIEIVSNIMIYFSLAIALNMRSGPAPHLGHLLRALGRRGGNQSEALGTHGALHDLPRGIANGDSASDLSKRLDELPSDLEQFFALMITNIDRVCQQRTSRLLLCLLHAESDFPVLAFQYLDLEESDPDYATARAWLEEPITEAQIRRLSRSKQFQITAQCKGSGESFGRPRGA